jgi:hypothetical protein
MATHRIPILYGVQPAANGWCWVEPYAIFATNDTWQHSIIRLGDPSPGINAGFYGIFETPQNYVSAPVIRIEWTTSVTTGNARFRFTYRTVGGDDTTSLDQAGNEQQVSVTDAAPGAAHRKMSATISLTAANFSTGDLVEYLLERIDDSGVDTIAADVIVQAVTFQYADV